MKFPKVFSRQINIPICPNPECPSHKTPDTPMYIKKGYYKTKFNHQPVPRYKCKACGANFSSHTSKNTFGQHKPHVNYEVFKLLNSGVTMRRIGVILRIHRRTVQRKFEWLFKRSVEEHRKALVSGAMDTSYAQFDEMETCMGNKKRPLSVPFVIRWKTGQIIDIRVAKMRLKGRLAQKYPDNRLYWDEDNRREMCGRVIYTLSKIAKQGITIASDEKKAYPNIIHRFIPNAKIETYKSRAVKDGFNPLFKLNHAAAKIRADLSRMRRRTWAITKCWKQLQKHLYIYVAWNNGYVLV